MATGYPPFRRGLRSGQVAALLTVGAWVASAWSAESSPGPAAADRGRATFLRDVQPVLEARCLDCHGPSKQKAGLRLDTLDHLLRGGENGPVVRPGEPAASAIVRMVRETDPETRMPSKGDPLRPDEISRLEAWIAALPHSAIPAQPRSSGHWAFQFPPKPVPPPVRDPARARNPIDRFVLAKLEAEGLQPSADADRSTLIRRLSFDLRGMPPAAAEIARFQADASPNAYEALVDRFLDAPAYGERWARHWLDVAHFGESHGYDKDKPRRNAWPYRDYVISALNRDTPYSRFVQAQLAGDVLFPDDPEGLVATGFVAAGPWDFVGHVELAESKTDGLIARYNDRDDMLMSTFTTFLSLTVHCARCHDHKFDPISQREYYRLQAVFAGVDRADRPYDQDPAIGRRRADLRSEEGEVRSRLEALEKRAHEQDPTLREAESRLSQLEKDLKASKADSSSADRKALESRREDAVAARDALYAHALGAAASDRDRHLRRLAGIQADLRALPPPSWVYAAANDFSPQGSFRPAGRPRPVHHLKRGDVRTPGETVEPGALACLPGLDPELGAGASGEDGARRAALARWLTAPGNLLLRRSIVNRVWGYHFGRGLVDTPNDFGRMGSAPTHPELLDWLAHGFVEQGESLKKLHRLIVTSATYRQTSTHREAPARVDADNRWLWRMNRQRLDAEAYHDTLLVLGGNLSPRMGGVSEARFVFKDDHSPVYDYAAYRAPEEAAGRRAVYQLIVRSVPDPLMECLDSADPSLSTPRRNTTLTALQALATLNNPFVLSQIERFARRVAERATDPGSQIDLAWTEAIGGKPSASGREALVRYARDHGLENALRVMLNSNAFMFID